MVRDLYNILRFMVLKDFSPEGCKGCTLSEDVPCILSFPRIALITGFSRTIYWVYYVVMIVTIQKVGCTYITEQCCRCLRNYTA